MKILYISSWEIISQDEILNRFLGPVAYKFGPIVTGLLASHVQFQLFE